MSSGREPADLCPESHRWGGPGGHRAAGAHPLGEGETKAFGTERFWRL